MAIPEINIKGDMPVVEVALSRLEAALRYYSVNARLVKIIHGYGSTGVGGKIRTAVRGRLSAKKTAGLIRDFIPGEEFSMFNAATQKALQLYFTEITGDRDYNRSNKGVTIVIIK